ncbi:Ccr4-not transcription complex, subunit [Cyanidiococcus yangmingshanensis]|uniref:poly(A)-specific ribonuclease n=1 Tax=Cyanidiococcus yangmingshanensis TaxID=2690220 RepID=A0A7J7IPF0_9RHOD|nr:Ccr4-not transcription complex, subunit [Cyanidiococcus yangmingshanensis]
MTGSELDSVAATGKGRPAPRFVEVFQENFERELDAISALVASGKYKLIAMDTEFPGVVARPLGSFPSSEDFQYQTLRCNVDLLKIIQVGLCVADPYGNLPSVEDAPSGNVWQFNFAFSLVDDIFAQSSVDMLQEAGINFEALQNHGIEPLHFGELLITSGLVLNEELTWITFHSGYDFGYLTKLCTADSLPMTRQEFQELVGLFFPRIFDIKCIMSSLQLHGGLNKLADTLHVRRHGAAHQAASDALLTLDAFTRLKQIHASAIGLEQCANLLYGLSFHSSMESATRNAAEHSNVTPESDTPHDSRDSFRVDHSASSATSAA